MYLRTTKRKNKDWPEVLYYQLAYNERHPETRKPSFRPSGYCKNWVFFEG